MRAGIRLTCALVWVWILNGDRCVLVRNGRGDGSSWWSLPGGGVEAGETLEAAAIREAREETGMEVRLDGLARLVDRVWPDGRWLFAEFTARVSGGSLGHASDPEGKIMEVRWADAAEVGERLGPAQRLQMERLLRCPPAPDVYQAQHGPAV